MIRREKLIKGLDVTGAGLEIGPLCWPVVKKDEAKIFYADHATTEQLKKLYKGDKGVPQDQIVPIDFALQGRTLPETVGSKRFNYIIASHVIEHVPDMIGWLMETASILKPGGVLSLAIPDKRFTFDIDRNSSTPGDIIGAYLDNHTRPDAATAFDFFHRYRTKIDASQVWSGNLYATEKSAPHRYSLEDALKYCKINRDTNEYVDMHVFVYTPESFVQILKTLIELNLLPFSVASFYTTAEGEYEFFIHLKKEKPTANNKQKLLKSLPRLAPIPTERELMAGAAKQDELHQKIATLQHQLDDILASNSWRLTAPLRKVIALLKSGK